MLNRNLILVFGFFISIFTLFFLFSHKLKLGIYPTHEMHFYDTDIFLRYLINYEKLGILKIYFAQIKTLPSVEYENLKSRIVYADFPPGSVLFTYIVFKLFNIKILLENLINFNLVLYYITLINVSLFFYIYYYKIYNLNKYFSVLFILSVLFFLTNPSLNFWMHLTLHYQSFGIFFQSLLILIVCLKDYKYINIKYYNALILIFGFIGLISDIIILFFFFCLIIKELLENNLRILITIQKSKIYLLTIFLASCFCILHWFLTNFDIISVILHRASISEDGRKELFEIINIPKFFIRQYSLVLTVILILLSIFTIIEFIKELFSKLRKFEILKVALIFLFPSLIYMIMFTNHFSTHNFVLIHLYFPIIFILFISAPKFILGYKNNSFNYLLFCTYLIFLLLINFSFYKSIFTMYPGLGVKYKDAAIFVEKNTNYYDVVFTENFPMYYVPPQLTNISNKNIHPISNYEDIKKFVNCMKVKRPNQYFRVKLFSKNLSNKIINQFSNSKIISYKNYFLIDVTDHFIQIKKDLKKEIGFSYSFNDNSKECHIDLPRLDKYSNVKFQWDPRYYYYLIK